MSILVFSPALTALPQHDFSLERKVQYWLEAASQHQTSRQQLHTDAIPTAPPCWLLLVDPTEGKEMVGSRAKEGTVRRSISLSADQGRGRASDTESEAGCSEDDECWEDDEYSSTSWEENDREENILRKRNRHGLQQIRPKTSPGLLEPPSENNYKAASPDLGKQRRSMVLFNNMKNELEAARRKLAALVHPLNRATAESKGTPMPPALPQHSRSNRSLKFGPAVEVSHTGSLVPAPPAAPNASMPPIRKHKPTVPVSCLVVGERWRERAKQPVLSSSQQSRAKIGQRCSVMSARAMLSNAYCHLLVWGLTIARGHCGDGSIHPHGPT